MKDIFKTQRDQACDARIQDEVITAKGIQADHPELSWTECLRLARDSWAEMPLA